MVKAITVLLEIIFVLCFIGLTLRFFGIDRVEDFTTVFYGVGAASFVLSMILRNNLKKKEHSVN